MGRITYIEIPPEGRIVLLKAYGPVKVFRTVRDSDGEVQYWATDDPNGMERRDREGAGQDREIPESARASVAESVPQV